MSQQSEEQTAFEAVFEFVENPPIEATFSINQTTSDLSYIHYQDIPSTIWEVKHGLGKYPSVTIVTSAGDVVYGDIIYIDINTVRLEFTASFAGRAYFN